MHKEMKKKIGRENSEIYIYFRQLTSCSIFSIQNSPYLLIKYKISILEKLIIKLILTSNSLELLTVNDNCDQV